MKFTVLFVTYLCTSTSWAIKSNSQEPTDKREVALSYGSHGHSAQSFQAPSLGGDDASAVSIGAGYSVGGGKPQYSFGGHGASASLQVPPEELQSSGHATLQLAPITLQPNHGAGGYVSNDLSQLMSQISQGINSGAFSLQSPSGGGALYQSLGHAQLNAGQELSLPQYTFGSPKLQYSSPDQSHAILSAFDNGNQGLGSHGSTGPVLFNTESHTGQQQPINLGAYSGHFLGEAPSLPHAGPGHSFARFSLGGAGHSSLSPSYRVLGNHYSPGKSSFKPSPYIGSAGHNDLAHSLPGHSGSYSAPSYAGAFSGYGASLNGLSGSSKLLTPSFVPPKSEGFGSSLEGIKAFASDGHLSASSPTSFGLPHASFSSSVSHAASSHSPQYYLSPTKQYSSNAFGEGSTSFRAPHSSHSSLSSSPSRYSFGGHGSSIARYESPKDLHGANSDSTYNTIKYSTELKPHSNY